MTREREGRGARRDLWVLGLGAILAAWFYFGSAIEAHTDLFSRQPSGYYGLQTAGFQAGHLYAALAPNPALLALPDPYDPVANAPYRVHDMTLFRGRYYLYFGVTPVLLVFWPMAALTGWYPTEPAVVASFCTAATWLGLGLLWAIRRYYLPAASRWALVLGSLSLFLANPLFRLVQGPQFYQVPISCAIFLQTAMLAVLLAAFLKRRGASGWLAAASLLFGLAVGARPNYLASGLALVAAPGLLACRSEGGQRRVAFLRLLPFALGPAAGCGAALLWYNWARFHSVTEFGMRYQLAGGENSSASGRSNSGAFCPTCTITS